MGFCILGDFESDTSEVMTICVSFLSVSLE
jgi:hypothetical protein